MGKQSFEHYAKLAKASDDFTVISGRYPFQSKAEKNIIKDIVNKLGLTGNDSVLEIGCGPGNLLIPLSFMVKNITGIDHKTTVNLLKSRIRNQKNISLIGTNFLDYSNNKKFDKILSYSVLHYLTNFDEVTKFISKALSYLKPGGKALFGDIPNVSTKERFLKSNKGKIFNNKWQISKGKQIKQSSFPNSDKKVIEFNDNIVLRMLKTFRNQGYHSYIYPQSPDLPYGHTREDIVIIKLR